MINWKVRVKNRWFWVALIPAVLLAAQALLAVIGVDIDVAGLTDRLLAACNAIFAALSIIGVTVDPTTEGLSDSTQAMSYTEPKPKPKT